MNKILSIFLISLTLLAYGDEDPFNAFIIIDNTNLDSKINIGIKAVSYTHLTLPTTAIV